VTFALGRRWRPTLVLGFAVAPALFLIAACDGREPKVEVPTTPTATANVSPTVPPHIAQAVSRWADEYCAVLKSFPYPPLSPVLAFTPTAPIDPGPPFSVVRDRELSHANAKAGAAESGAHALRDVVPPPGAEELHAATLDLFETAHEARRAIVPRLEGARSHSDLDAARSVLAGERPAEATLVIAIATLPRNLRVALNAVPGCLKWDLIGR
jgi:hypothetical protein